MVTTHSKKIGRGQRRSAPRAAESRIRGSYKRREEREALLRANPHCQVVDEVTVWCRICNKQIVLDRRPKSLSSPTGGFYGSNWRKHWLTKHIEPDTHWTDETAKAGGSGIVKRNTKLALASTPASRPLFLADSQCDEDSRQGTSFDLGSWMFSVEGDRPFDEFLASSNDVPHLELESKEGEPAYDETFMETGGSSHEPRGDSHCFASIVPPSDEHSSQGLADVVVSGEDVEAARILVNLSKAGCICGSYGVQCVSKV